VLKRLKSELAEALPNANEVPIFSQLEQLPWLGAIIQEILRLHPGVVSRLPRVSPDEPVVYRNKNTGKDYVVPAGTSMNMTTKVLHMSPEVFVDPYDFRPERWIENPRLDRFLIAFARGTRNCLGQDTLLERICLL
jgi:cytochrome P450